MIVRIPRLSLAALSTVIAVGIAAPLQAQHVSPPSNAPAESARSQPGPTIERAAVGARPISQSDASLDAEQAAMQQRLGLGQARALMIVGFAAVVIGLLMDNDPGTLIAVGGAVVGLYGLYHYLR
jgi:hypothetical protein